MFEEILAEWPGERVVIGRDAPSGAWMFVCIHSTALGPALGGTRLAVYATPGEGLADGVRLAAGMTAKNALAGVGFGGGKAVIAVHRMPAGGVRDALLLRYADFVSSLRGQFLTGPDMNTGPEDMDLMSERTPYVFCRTEARGGSGSSSPATAAGVFHGIRASLDHVFGSPDPNGRTVLIQGVGSVGRVLARMLIDAGARVLVADVDPVRARAAAEDLGAAAVEPGRAMSTPCDVLAPCAVGGVLDEESIARLRCRIVAGSANNQLATPQAAAQLRDAGILYAPDFVISAGGIVHAIGRETLGFPPSKVATRIEAIGATLSAIFDDASRGGITTEAAAIARVHERLAAARPAA